MRLTSSPASDMNSSRSTPSLPQTMRSVASSTSARVRAIQRRHGRLVDLVDARDLFVGEATHGREPQQQAIAIGQRGQRVAHRRFELGLVAIAQVVDLGVLLAGQELIGEGIGARRARRGPPQIQRDALRRHRNPACQRSPPRVRQDPRRLPRRPDEHPLPQRLAHLVAQLRAAIDARHSGVDRRAAEAFDLRQSPGHAGRHRRRPSAKSSTNRSARPCCDVVADDVRQVNDEARRVDRQIGPRLDRLLDDLPQARLQGGGVTGTWPLTRGTTRQALALSNPPCP